MKKISLKDVKKGLSRDEMRVVSGGCGYGSYGSCYVNCYGSGWGCIYYGGGYICSHP